MSELAKTVQKGTTFGHWDPVDDADIKVTSEDGTTVTVDIAAPGTNEGYLKFEIK